MSVTAQSVTAQSVTAPRPPSADARARPTPELAPARALSRKAEPLEAWVFVFGFTLLATLGIFFWQVGEYTTLLS
jgi:hypothetical protein